MVVSGLERNKGGKAVWRTSLAALAARSGELNALERYVTNCSDLDAKDEDGLALIHYAACHGNLPLIRLLSERDADMNLPDGGSPAWRPIHYAIFHRQAEVERVLRTFGVEAPLPILKRLADEKLRSSWCETETDVSALNLDRSENGVRTSRPRILTATTL